MKIADPDQMPLMRAFEIWLQRIKPDADPRELVTIVLAVYTRLREVMEMESVMFSLDMSLQKVEAKLREGYAMTDPETLEPRPFIIKELRDEMGEVRYREMVNFIETLEVPDYVPSDLE